VTDHEFLDTGMLADARALTGPTMAPPPTGQPTLNKAMR
jgi:hypothetical protein